MADPLDNCPAYVKSRTFYVDTLTASVPYRTVDETVITVPPLADANKPFEMYVANEALPLTRPGDVENDHSPPGWNTVEELSARNRLRSLITTIQAEAVSYPEVRNLAERLAASAASDLDQVEEIYDDWADVYFWAAYSENQISCWQRHKLARPDKQGWFEIPLAGSNQTKRVKIAGKWGACRLDLGAEWPYIRANILPLTTQQGILDGFAAISPLLDSELTVRYGYLGDADKIYNVLGRYEEMAEHLYDAIKAARERAREKIRELYRHAYESLWCAEYGIAQGESYSTNKKLWQGRYGDMPVLVTPTGGGGGGVSPLLPGGPKLEAPHIPEECFLFGTNCPPPREQPPGLGVEGPLPPIEEPVPEPAPSAPTKWYGTVAGKIGIGVGAVTVLAGGYYGIQYARTRA